MALQENERKELEEAHISEYAQLNKAWDESTTKMEVEHEQFINDLEIKHTKELEENRVKLETELPTLPKPSSEVLNLKKMQEQLGNQGQ